jgi:autotransporter translocation and assembly factor TamB
MKFFLHIPIALILILFGAVAVTVYVITQTTLVHRGINMLLAQYIESKYNVKIDYGEIAGSIFEYLTVDDVRVDFEKAPHRYRLLKIKRLEAHYNFNNILHGVWHFDSLIVDEPTLVLRSDSTGKLLIPELGGRGDSKSENRLKVTVDHFQLNNGRFEWFKLPWTYYVDSVTIIGAALLNNGDFRASVDSVSLNYAQKGFHLKELKLNAVLENRAISIDSLYVLTDSSRLNGSGTYPLDSASSYHFVLKNSHISLHELSDIAGLSLVGGFDFSLQVTGRGAEFGGNADLDGTLFERRLGPANTDYAYANGVLSFRNLKGQAFDGFAEGSMDMNLIARPETYSGDLRVTGVNLDKIVPNTFKSRINGVMQISGSGLGANSFSLDLDVACGKGSIDFVNYDSLNGTISLNVNDMYFHPGFALNYRHSRFTAEGVVDYNGEMMLNGDFGTTQLADFWGDLFIKELSGGARASYVVTGSDIDPDIRGVFYGDSCSFYGLATDSVVATFDIKSFLYRRLGSVEAKTYKSNVWALPADSLVAAVDIDSNLVTIGKARLYHPRYSMDAKALAIVADSTASVEVSDFQFTFDSLQYANTAPIPVEFLPDRIVVDKATMKGKEGEVGIYCDYGYDSTIVLRAETQSFEVSPWLRDLQLDTLLSGTLKLKGEITGKLCAPKIKLEGSMSDLAYGADSLGTAATTLNFEDSAVVFDDLTLHFEGGTASAQGKFPLILNFDSGLVVVPQEPMAFTVKSSGDDLSILSSLNDNLESLTGDYDLQLDVYGTPQQPQTKGSFNLKNGTAKVYQMENPIEDIQAEVTSQDKLITLEWAEGKARYKGKEGSVRATGKILIRSLQYFDYDLAAVAFDLPIKYDLGDIYGLCDAELEIKGYDPPKITGNVTVKEATYYEEFSSEEVSAAIEAADTIATWDYELNCLLLPGSVVVKNSDVNMIVDSDGDLAVLRQGTKDNYIGTLNINRGSYYLGDLNFRIESGSQLIFDNVELPNPNLDIKASARLRTYSGEATSQSSEPLDLVIGGTLLQPTINAAAGSSYSNQDIVMLIVMNQPTSSSLGSTPLQSRIQVGGLGLLTNLMSQRLSRTFGVEVFDLTPTYNDRNTISGATVTVGLYTLPNVYTYVSSLSLDGKAEYGAEYRLGRHVYTAVNLDRDKLWQLALNLKWEFR